MTPLRRGKEAAVRAARSDADPYLAQALGAVAHVCGAGSVAIYPLIHIAALEKHAYKRPTTRPGGTYIDLGDFLPPVRAFHLLAGYLQNVIRIVHNIYIFIFDAGVKSVLMR